MRKTACAALVIVAGAAMTAGVEAGPTKRPATQPMASKQGQFPLVTDQLQGRLVAKRVARVRLIDGQVVRIGEWIDRDPTQGGVDVPDTVYFDAFEFDTVANAPTGFCTSGCTQAGNCPGNPPHAGSVRFSHGDTLANPFVTTSMTVGTGANGAEATLVRFAWRWRPAFTNQCLVAIITHETFNECAAGPPGSSGDFDGIVYDFGLQAPGTGYFFASEDLSMTPGLFHKMPVDGSGAYTVFIANAEDPVTGVLTPETNLGTQPMIWGTGDHENPPDGRIGTQGRFLWYDHSPSNGQHTANECIDGLWTQDICPNPRGMMVMFVGEPVGGGCYPNCDGSTTQPILNIDDFVCFVNAFAVGSSLPPEQQVNHYSNCDGSTTQPVLNIDDFTCFVSAFAAGC